MPSSLQWLANWVWELLTEHRIGTPFFTPTRISQVEGTVLTSPRMMETLSCFWFTWGRRCLHLHGCQTMEPLVLQMSNHREGNSECDPLTGQQAWSQRKPLELGEGVRSLSVNVFSPGRRSSHFRETRGPNVSSNLCVICLRKWNN